MPNETKYSQKRYNELTQQIREHDRRYYIDDSPTISDREYDRLFEELKTLEQQYPDLSTPDSPTQRVGAAPKEGFTRVTHKARMYSLDNTYSQDELREFLRRVERGLDGEKTPFVVEPKLDGASIELTYNRGSLVLAATRGDGVEGEDVTSTIRTIRSVPLRIKEQEEVVVRGEVFINRDDLEKVNRQREADGESLFANPRNAASGSLRLLDPAVAAKRPLRIYLYELALSPHAINSHIQCLDWLAHQELPTHKLQMRCESPQQVFDAVARFSDRRPEYPYDIDGAVVKVDDLDKRNVLGYTARFPKWAVAFKFETEQAQTRLLDITIQVGRTGALTPVANLEPVLLAGSTVSRASLHNEDEIRSKDIRVGDEVIVEKAGEVIPHVVGVIPANEQNRGAPFAMPTSCPVCHSPAVRLDGDAKWRCTNRLACPGQQKASLLHFARRAAMDIEHFGPSLADQLLSNDLIEDPADLYGLTVEQISALERMAQKSAKNLITSIQKSKERSLDRLISGLGIPLVGEIAAKLLATRYGTLEEFTRRDPIKEAEELAEVHGIGPKIAQSVGNALADERFAQVLRKFLDLGMNASASQARSGVGELAGLSFCVTGKLARPRPRIHEMIRAAGGEVHTAVKKGTTYLVAGEKVGKSKLDKAQKAGTRIIDEATLATLIKKESPDSGQLGLFGKMETD